MKAFSLLKKKKSFSTGVHLTDTHVIIAQLRSQDSGYLLEHYSFTPLPKATIENGDIKNVDQVADAIRLGLSHSSVEQLHANMAVSSANIMTKTLQIASGLSGAEVEEQVLLQAGQVFPGMQDKLSFEYIVTGLSDDKQFVDILLLACRQDVVQSKLALFEKAGLSPSTVDVDCYALKRVSPTMSDLKHIAGGVVNENTVVALLDLDITTARFVVHTNGNELYSRTHPFNGRPFFSALSQRLSGKESISEILFELEKENLNPLIFDELMQLLMPDINQLMRLYSSANVSGRQIDCIVLSGECVILPGIDRYIRQETSIPTFIANPLKHISASGALETQKLSNVAPVLTIPCGLAMNGFAYD